MVIRRVCAAELKWILEFSSARILKQAGKSYRAESSSRESAIRAPHAGLMFRYTSLVGLAALTMVLFAWRKISRSVVILSFSVTIKSVSIGLLSFSCPVMFLKTRPSEELDIINRRHVIKHGRERMKRTWWKGTERVNPLLPSLKSFILQMMLE